MATRRNQQPSQNGAKRPLINSQISNGGYFDIPLGPLRTTQRTSLIEPPNLNDMKKSIVTHNGLEYQLIPVEIEKDAEIGLVVGQIEGQQWVFIDEILPNGMIDMHGILKEGDYIIQAGDYQLIGIDVTTALVLIERAFDEGKKSILLVAARQVKSDVSKPERAATPNKKNAVSPRERTPTVGSFVEYEKDEEEEEDPEENQDGYYNSPDNDENDTQF